MTDSDEPQRSRDQIRQRRVELREVANAEQAKLNDLMVIAAAESTVGRPGPRSAVCPPCPRTDSGARRAPASIRLT